MKVYLWRQKYSVYYSMHALRLGPLVARNKGVSNSKIAVVKLRLPEKSFEKILAFGKPGESLYTIRRDKVIHSEPEISQNC